jgi:hypothetical protein
MNFHMLGDANSEQVLSVKAVCTIDDLIAVEIVSSLQCSANADAALLYAACMVCVIIVLVNNKVS